MKEDDDHIVRLSDTPELCLVATHIQIPESDAVETADLFRGPHAAWRIGLESLEKKAPAAPARSECVY